MWSRLLVILSVMGTIIGCTTDRVNVKCIRHNGKVQILEVTNLADHSIYVPDTIVCSLKPDSLVYQPFVSLKSSQFIPYAFSAPNLTEIKSNETLSIHVFSPCGKKDVGNTYLRIYDSDFIWRESPDPRSDEERYWEYERVNSYFVEFECK